MYLRPEVHRCAGGSARKMREHLGRIDETYKVNHWLLYIHSSQTRMTCPSGANQLLVTGLIAL